MNEIRKGAGRNASRSIDILRMMGYVPVTGVKSEGARSAVYVAVGVHIDRSSPMIVSSCMYVPDAADGRS